MSRCATISKCIQNIQISNPWPTRLVLVADGPKSWLGYHQISAAVPYRWRSLGYGYETSSSATDTWWPWWRDDRHTRISVTDPWHILPYVHNVCAEMEWRTKRGAACFVGIRDMFWISKENLYTAWPPTQPGAYIAVFWRGRGSTVFFSSDAVSSHARFEPSSSRSFK